MPASSRADLDRGRRVVRFAAMWRHDGGVKCATAIGHLVEMSEVASENRELRRANEILKSAAAFFGAQLDRRPKK